VESACAQRRRARLVSGLARREIASAGCRVFDICRTGHRSLPLISVDTNAAEKRSSFTKVPLARPRPPPAYPQRVFAGIVGLPRTPHKYLPPTFWHSQILLIWPFFNPDLAACAGATRTTA